MKVFLSWSGEPSRSLATVLKQWIPNVLQNVRPFMSEEDIGLGRRWSPELSRELDKSALGLVIVTPTNLDAPWLNFEAGAIGKSLDDSRVIPVLFGLAPHEVVKGPLAQFQMRQWSRKTVADIMLTLNGQAPQPLEEHRLSVLVDHWWPDLEAQVSALDLTTGSYFSREMQQFTRGVSAARASRLEELVQEATHVVDSATKQLWQVAQGRTARPTNDADLLIRCAGLVERSLRGTSERGDGPWWESTRGQAYLDANSAAAARPGVVVERIFYSEGGGDVDRIVNLNKLAGVACFIVEDAGEMERDPTRNFTIFDDVIMHQDQARAVGREQVFTTDAYEIRQLAGVFEAHKRRARHV